MARHLCFPGRQSSPGSCVPDLLRRREESAGVGDRPAADGAAMVDGYMAKKAHIEEAAQAELRTPEPAMDGPTCAGEGVGSPTPPHLQYCNSIPFLHQSKGGDASPEAGSDDDEIVIEFVVARRHTSTYRATLLPSL